MAFWLSACKLHLDSSTGWKECHRCHKTISVDIPFVNIMTHKRDLVPFHIECLAPYTTKFPHVLELARIHGEGNLEVEDVQYCVERLNRITEVMYGGSCSKWNSVDAISRYELYAREHQRDPTKFEANFRQMEQSHIVDTSLLASTPSFSKHKMRKLDIAKRNPNLMDYNDFSTFTAVCNHIALIQREVEKTLKLREITSSLSFNGDFYVWLKLIMPQLENRPVITMEYLFKLFQKIIKISPPKWKDLMQRKLFKSAIFGELFDDQDDILPLKESRLTIHQVDVAIEEMLAAYSREDELSLLKCFKRTICMCTTADLVMLADCLSGRAYLSMGFTAGKSTIEGFHRTAIRVYTDCEGEGPTKLKRFAYWLAGC
ncbi:hypothetical protein HDE_04054 [Halotydeus destructor]|nr:hypothetical protein HDE_04054 [Halotydeus destructor]